MKKLWSVFPYDTARVERLERLAGVTPVVARLLLARGVEAPDAVRAFLDPRLTNLRGPEELPGLSAAAELIYQSVTGGRRIMIYGDYDADGMTATAILYRCLKLIDADVGYFIPNRMEHGYGLNSDSIRELAEGGVQTLVTVDCGITSVEEVRLARELGMQVVITDHHEPADELPDADAIVHPRLPGGNYPFGGLCGAGVAFKLAWGLGQLANDGQKKVSPRMQQFLLSALQLAAIGTVADVVPLLDENRILVRCGLMGAVQTTPPVGLQALMQVTKLTGKSSLGGEDIGFSLAPRLNAAGRLGQANLAVELLTTESQERAESLAEYLDQLNENRGTIERSIYRAANKMIKEKFDIDADPAFVLGDRQWHPGVIGIVAGRLAEKYARPVILISMDKFGNDPGTGSARSAGTVNLFEVLGQCSDHLASHGGHAAAAGLRIAPEKIDRFREDFCEQVSAEMTDGERVVNLRIDAETHLGGLTWQTIQDIERLAPFGQDNPRPLLCADGVLAASPGKTMGQGDRHLSVQIRQGSHRLRAVAFGQGERVEEWADIDCPMDIAFRPVINEFNGRRTIELHLEDWHPSEDKAG